MRIATTNKKRSLSRSYGVWTVNWKLEVLRLIVGGTQRVKRAVPIYDVDYILGACREKVSLLQIGRDYEQKAFVESLLQVRRRRWFFIAKTFRSYKLVATTNKIRSLSRSYNDFEC